MTKHNTPALRFDGFDDEWTQSRLSDYLTLSEDTNANLEFGREDVYAVSLEEGLVNQIKFHGRSFAGKDLDNYDVIHSGEIVYTKSPLKFTPYGIFKSHFGATGIVSPLYAVYRTKPHANARFVQDYFALPERLNTYLSPLVNKGAKNTMNISDWNALGGAVTFPPSLEEQRAIGELFADFDELMEQHRTKHANLQQTKTALLQRMFPRDGADEPELRLGGFSNPWVLRHLGEFEITTGPFGSTLHAEDYVEHGTPIVTTEHFRSGLLPLTGQGVPQVSDDDRRRLKAYWLQKNDIVFSRVGSVDINARVTELQNGWLFSGRVLRVRPDATCESQFLHSVLETDSVRGSIRKRAVGMSMPSINTAILANTSFYQPSTLEEQRAIGEVFSNLDALIAAEQRYITQLTQAKTALLQRMFV